MNKYYIGIIDEDQDEILDIKRTIYINKPDTIADELIQFVDYPLPQSVESLSKKMSDVVINDIIGGMIHALIVDYRIIVESTCIDGTEIFQRISSLVPKFPTIILTNVPNDCYKPYVDADKVYAKRTLLKIDEDYSREKVLNIFRNIENYRCRRASLTAKLTEQLFVLESEGYSPERYQSIIEVEKILSDYLPQDQTLIEKEMDLSELKDAVDLLKEASRLLGEKNEN